jgi:hypothetical protein
MLPLPWRASRRPTTRSPTRTGEKELVRPRVLFLGQNRARIRGRPQMNRSHLTHQLLQLGPIGLQLLPLFEAHVAHAQRLTQRLAAQRLELRAQLGILLGRRPIDRLQAPDLVCRERKIRAVVQ